MWKIQTIQPMRCIVCCVLFAVPNNRHSKIVETKNDSNWNLITSSDYRYVNACTEELRYAV